MEKLTVAKRLSVVKLYLSGLSHQEIHAKTNVAVGSVSTIISELKEGVFPEAGDLGELIDILREVALGLKHAGISPGQSAVGLTVLKRLEECDLDVADIERLHEILKLAGGPDKAKEFVAAVYRIRDFQEKSHLTLDAIDAKVMEMEEKAAELQPTINKVNERKQEIADLEKKRDDLIPVVDNLEYKHNLLNPVVKDLQSRQSSLIKQIKEEEAITASTQAGLAKWNSEMQKLAKAGFTLDGLTLFNDKVVVIAARHHIAAPTLQSRLFQEMKLLDKGLTLETLLKARRSELQMERKAVASVQVERKALEAAIGTLSGQKAILESNIKTLRENISQELANIVSAAKETLVKFTVELHHGNDEILMVVKQLKDGAFEAGKDIGLYEGIVHVNEWLIDLQSLMKGGDGLEVFKVRGILLLLLRGVQSWIKLDVAKPGLPPNLSSTIEHLVMQLEGWVV